MKRNLPAWLIPAISVLIFFLTGLALIPYPGLQNDELFFSGPLYFTDAAFYRIGQIPVMVMSYSGALKTWLYWALFQVVEPNEWSVRIPVLLMGMATVWLTWVWVRRLAGSRAAAIAAVLLATDAMFLMTDTFDWGPVALQHLLLMGGLVAFDTWLRDLSYPHQSGSEDRTTGQSYPLATALEERSPGHWVRIAKPVWLALAFFLWGLGIWDKALLAWPLGGLALASICIYPRETLRRLRPIPLAVAAVAFLIGASPLVNFNVALHGQTATANAHFTAEGIGGKVAALRHTIDGTTLFGYMVYAKDAEHRIEPRNVVGRIAASIASIAGDHKSNLMLPAYLAALIGFVLLAALGAPERRLLTFLLVTMLVAWAQMAFTKGTGGAVHHVILLWPFPVVFLAIGFELLARRAGRVGPHALLAAVVVLAGENLLNTNEYLKDMAVYGTSGGWTDAIYRLAGSVGKPNQANWYALVDWGYLNGLRLFFEGDLPMFEARVPAADATPTPEDLAEIRREIDNTDRLFIQHTEDKQMFPGVNDRLRAVTQQLGYTEKVERVVHDRNGRPVFELFRFEKLP